MTYARRTDGPHKAVMQALRKIGWHVEDTSRLGGGFPDLVIAKAGRLVLVEVKDGSKPPSAQKLTADEASVFFAFQSKGVSVRVVRSIEDAIQL